jgi:uncharacterized cupredoxin-like copper-binding protein
VAVVLVVLVASAGLGLITSSPAGTATSGGVAVALAEWKVVPAPAAVRAGRVTLVARNNGTMAHELVVLRSTRAAARLPIRGGKAVETGRVAKISNIASGVSKRVTLKLRPGRYVLICNLLGHYQAGQFSALRVR